MDSEILLVREADGYRILCGRQRLIAALRENGEAFADVESESGRAKVFRTANGFQVSKDSRHLPLKDFSDADSGRDA